MMNPRDSVVIASTARTPVGSFNGALSSLPAHELGAIAIKEALHRAEVAPIEVDEVIMGQVLTAAAGQNPARQAAMAAGIPAEATAMTINQLCGSGMRAIALAAQQVRDGSAHFLVAGGMESMSQAPHAAHLRSGQKMGDLAMVDTMIKDGLWDAFNGYHMGQTAENIATRYGITREDQDRFAVASQNKAEFSQKQGFFRNEIVPVTVKGRKGDTVVEHDEYIRHGATYEQLAALRPAFTKDGTVTAGNASGLNDGAAAMVIMKEDLAKVRRLAGIGRILSWAQAGVDPAYMGLGPIPAAQKALDLAGWTWADVDLVESNEAFAAQSIAVQRELNIDPEKLNINGGAIALGHPIGASGARILTTLLFELHRSSANRGIAMACIGGGMGIAMCVETIDA
jgi:acetyl-CoA C-acetyltransferase